MSHLTEAAAETVAPYSAPSTGGLYTRLLKRWLDLGLILLAAPFVAPLILALAALVRRDGAE